MKYFGILYTHEYYCAGQQQCDLAIEALRFSFHKRSETRVEYFTKTISLIRAGMSYSLDDLHKIWSYIIYPRITIVCVLNTRAYPSFELRMLRNASNLMDIELI